MDPIYSALFLYKQNRLDEAISVTNETLETDPTHKPAWLLKAQCLIDKNIEDEIELDTDNLTDEKLGNDEAFVKSKTGKRTAKTGADRNNLTTAMNASGQVPGTKAGYLRPETQARLTTASGNKTAKTARPVTGMTGRAVRLKTAMATNSNKTDDPTEFIDTARLDCQRYGSDIHFAPILFDYLLHFQPDIRFSLQLATAAIINDNYQNSFWRTAVGKCYLRMGMLRKAETEFNFSKYIDIEALLLLSKVYCKLYQYTTAVRILEHGLKVYPENINIYTSLARIYNTELDDSENSEKSINYYVKILQIDRTNVEALSSLAQNYFYNGHAEVALKMYQQLLSQSSYNSEISENKVQIFNNIGLCCYYIEKIGLGLNALKEALKYAEDEEEQATIWYNIGLLATSTGQFILAKHAYSMAITISNEKHIQAINNLGVIEFKINKIDSAVNSFKSAKDLVDNSELPMYEPSFNLGCCKEKQQEYNECYEAFKDSLDIFPGNKQARRMLNSLGELMSAT